MKSHHITTQTHPLHQRKLFMRGLFSVAITLGLIYAVQAATGATTPAKTSDIEILALDASNSNIPINGVSVTLTGASSGASCASGMTATTTNRPNVLTRRQGNGFALFKDCSTGNTSRKYNIGAASFAGYSVSPKTPSFMKKGIFRVSASKSSKKRNKIITLFMVKTVVKPPTPPRNIVPIGGPDNGTNGSEYCKTGTGSGDDGYGNYVNTSSNGTGGSAPSPAGGAWIVNTTAGYYMGQACAGWNITVSKKSPAGWFYGSIKRPDGTTFDGSANGCGWSPPATVAYATPITANACDDSIQASMADRTTIGVDFNCFDENQPTGEYDWCDGGTSFLLPVNGCNNGFYLNYNRTTGTYLDKVGDVVAPMGMSYRYTTLDGKAAIVSTKQYGWGYIDKGCIPAAHKGVISTGGTDPNDGSGKPHPGYTSYNVNCGKDTWVSNPNQAVPDPSKPGYYTCP